MTQFYSRPGPAGQPRLSGKVKDFSLSAECFPRTRHLAHKPTRKQLAVTQRLARQIQTVMQF